MLHNDESIQLKGSSWWVNVFRRFLLIIESVMFSGCLKDMFRFWKERPLRENVIDCNSLSLELGRMPFFFWLIPYGEKPNYLGYSIDIQILRISLKSFLNDEGLKKGKYFSVLDNLFYCYLIAGYDP